MIIFSWIDIPHQVPGMGELTEEYEVGINQFVGLASNQDMALQTGKMVCIFSSCKNCRSFDIDNIWRHLYNKGL